MDGVLVMDSGANQILKYHATPEDPYGETIVTTDWTTLGLIESGDISGKTSINKIYGIGSAAAQARFAGVVNNTLNCVLVSPTDDVMNLAITRTLGILDSFNFVAGQGGAAWKGVGLKFDTLDLDIDSENPLKVTMGGIFKSVVDIVDPETAEAATPILWQPQGLVLSLDPGGEDALVSSCKISVKNNLSSQAVAHYDEAGLNRTIGLLKEGNFEIDATIQTFTAPAAWDLEDDDLACAGNEIDLVLTFIDLCGGAYTTPGSLVITCSGGIIIEKSQPLKPNEYTDYSVGMTFTDITIVETAGS